MFIFLTVREVRSNKISGWGAQNCVWALRCLRELIHRRIDAAADPVLRMSKQTGGGSCSRVLTAGKEWGCGFELDRDLKLCSNNLGLKPGVQ